MPQILCHSQQDVLRKVIEKWLSYFDPVRMIIVDPMHNLLLGLAKTQWYQEWIKTDTLCPSTKRQIHELELIHQFLEEFEAPLWAGRLPLRVGEPAGGSLMADEYKFAVTGPWPIIVCCIQIHDCQIIRSFTFEKLETWESHHRSKKPEVPPEPGVCMHTDEPINFLQFSTVLKLLLASKIYGPESMKPNQHWVVHSPDQIRDYGPVYNFWEFLTECLNKVLKNMNMNSNNRPGGRQEVSMMREFSRKSRVEALVCKVPFTFSHLH
ncbi:hypothetical protein C8J56DRAFT_1004280 [Mycena floridula]|nr:hypothetical protein C8J56DRAFT_1004280 [Mycena floridula]